MILTVGRFPRVREKLFHFKVNSFTPQKIIHNKEKWKTLRDISVLFFPSYSDILGDMDFTQQKWNILKEKYCIHFFDSKENKKDFGIYGFYSFSSYRDILGEVDFTRQKWNILKEKCFIHFSLVRMNL